MSHRIILIYGAFPTINEYDKRGDVLGWYSTEHEAKIKAIGHGWYGGNGAADAVAAIQVDDGPIFRLAHVTPIVIGHITEDEQLKVLRNQALAKLTPEEQQLLGLKYEHPAVEGFPS